MIKKEHFLIAVFLEFFAFGAHAQIFSDESIAKDNQFPLKFSGTSDFSGAFYQQNSVFENKFLPNVDVSNTYSKGYGFGNNSKLYGKIENEYEDLTYGFSTKFELEANSNQNRARIDLDEAFVFAQNDYGKVELGNVVAVNQKMKVGPAKFARGGGGINGNYLKYINLPNANINLSNIKTPSFILVPQSPIGHGGYAVGFNDSFNNDRLRVIRSRSFKGSEDAFKINYYTPRMNGFQFGTSYTNSTQNSAASSTIFSPIVVNEVLSLGANYTNNIDNFGYAISATAESGKFNKDKNSGIDRNNLNSFDIATTLTYFGFTFGGSFGSWQRSLQEKSGINSCEYSSNIAIANQNCTLNAQKFNSASYYTLGISYQIGHLGTSITTMESSFQKNDYSTIAFDIDYKIKKHFTTYLEVAKFEFKSNQVKALDVANKQISDNKGYVTLLGFLYSF
ncbi:MAG: porin [Pelagibacterales bacterium]|nr:porin [Pelagibacterales bacterium]